MHLNFQLYILDPDASTILVTPSPLVKAVTNVLNLTKTLDVFDVEEQPSENLECQCPNVSVEKGYISKLEPSKNVSKCMFILILLSSFLYYLSFTYILILESK